MAASALPRLALTPGDPAGIGAELVVALADTDIAADFVALADPELLRRAAATCGRTLTIESDDATPRHERRRGSVRCVAIERRSDVVPGRLDTRNAAYVIETLQRASDGCLAGTYDAVVTAPVHKGVINDAGMPFRGHTEFFAERAHADVVMLLATPTLRVALATTHLALADVPRAITRDGLARVLRVLHADLRRKFAIAQPRIAVLGLNPHAGEGGHLGREEIDTIVPILEQLRGEGMHLLGPWPADTAFVPAQLARCDAVLAMYHDQGLPVLKAQGFGDAVNVTLGLPYVRTSVDHGTALDLAGTGTADPASLIAAARMALDLVHRARR